MLSLMISSMVISSFDAFGGSRRNNSGLIADKIVRQLARTHPQLVVKHCRLRTVYDLASEQLMDCVSAMAERPQLVLSLGEGKITSSKIEIVAHNLDRDISHDNDGVHRHNTPIVPGGVDELGLSLPYHRMICGLSSQQKAAVIFSRHAGTFVCNNTAYLFRHHMSDINYGFIHVPRYQWAGNTHRVNSNSAIIYSMLSNLLTDREDHSQSLLPEIGEQRDWPTSKFEVQSLLASAKDDCSREFLGEYLEIF